MVTSAALALTPDQLAQQQVGSGAVTSRAMKDSFDRVTADGYLADLLSRPMEAVRAMRAECQALENAVSYVRRVAQGRLDIVGAELVRRRAGGDPTDLSELIGLLPDILADRTRPGTTSGARPTLDLFDDAPGDEYSAEVDAIFSATDVGALTALDDAHLEEVRERLAAYEQLTSARRQRLHGIIDALQAEITRRYRTGEASVDSLLR